MFPSFRGIRKWNELIPIIEEINARKLKIRNKQTQYLVMDIQQVVSTVVVDGVQENMYHEDLVGVLYANHSETDYWGQISIKNLYRFWEVIDPSVEEEYI